jgi:hypothetical protein
MTPNELMTTFTDPTKALELQRKATLTAFDAALDAHEQGRKLTAEAWKHTLGGVQDWMKPCREASEEMTAAGHDLTRRAIEVTRGEVDRWYGTFLGI